MFFIIGHSEAIKFMFYGRYDPAMNLPASKFPSNLKQAI